MNLKRASLVAAGGGALAVWLAAAATPGSGGAPIVAPSKPTALDAQGAELSGEVERLRERLRPSAEPRAPGRNLFRYAASRSRDASGRAQLTEAGAVTVAPASALPTIKLDFIGVAESAGEQGTVRTAILTAGGQLVHAREGESVASRYRVTRITSELVELVDTVDGATTRLVLR
jgi:hypothetical protein